MIHPIKPIAKNIRNGPWRVEGRTNLGYWPYKYCELALEEKVFDGFIMMI
jgi:hypothetical protein